MHPNDNLIYNHVHWNRLSENMDVNGNTNNSISPPKRQKQWESERNYLEEQISSVSNRCFEQTHIIPKSHPIIAIPNPLNSKDLSSPTYSDSLVSPTNSLAIVKTDSKCSPNKCSPNKNVLKVTHPISNQSSTTNKTTPPIVNKGFFPSAPKPARKNIDSHPHLSPNTATHLFDVNQTRSQVGHIHAACANPDHLKTAPQCRGKADPVNQVLHSAPTHGHGSNRVHQSTTDIPGNINKDKISRC